MDTTKTVEQINKLINGTKERKIPWRITNGSIARWLKNDGGKVYSITIQTVQPADNYALTIQCLNPSKVLLQVNSLNDSSLKSSLFDLFSQILTNIKNESTEKIDDLLKDL